MSISVKLLMEYCLRTRNHLKTCVYKNKFGLLNVDLLALITNILLLTKEFTSKYKQIRKVLIRDDPPPNKNIHPHFDLTNQDPHFDLVMCPNLSIY